jgi:hypothetical protein
VPPRPLVVWPARSQARLFLLVLRSGIVAGMIRSLVPESESA